MITKRIHLTYIRTGSSTLDAVYYGLIDTDNTDTLTSGINVHTGASQSTVNLDSGRNAPAITLSRDGSTDYLYVGIVDDSDSYVFDAPLAVPQTQIGVRREPALLPLTLQETTTLCSHPKQQNNTCVMVGCKCYLH